MQTQRGAVCPVEPETWSGRCESSRPRRRFLHRRGHASAGGHAALALPPCGAVGLLRYYAARVNTMSHSAFTTARRGANSQREFFSRQSETRYSIHDTRGRATCRTRRIMSRRSGGCRHVPHERASAGDVSGICERPFGSRPATCIRAPERHPGIARVASTASLFVLIRVPLLFLRAAQACQRLLVVISHARLLRILLRAAPAATTPATAAVTLAAAVARSLVTPQAAALAAAAAALAARAATWRAASLWRTGTLWRTASLRWAAPPGGPPRRRGARRTAAAAARLFARPLGPTRLVGVGVKVRARGRVW